MGINMDQLTKERYVPIFTPNEAHAFNADLDRYMAAEVAADKRDEWINEKAKELFAGEYSPFLPANVLEAVSEMQFSDQMLFGAYLSACAAHPDNDVSQVTLCDFLVDRIGDYWATAARSYAETLFDKRDY
jgi:hypothetical protein